MKYKINRLLNKFGYWLIQKTYIVTATEIMIRERIKTLRCEHCGESLQHYLDDCGCKANA